MTSPVTKPAIPTTIRIEPMIGATVSTIIISISRNSSPMQCITSDITSDITFVDRAVALRTAVTLVFAEVPDDDLLEVVIPVEGYADCLLGIEAGALADVCV